LSSLVKKLEEPLDTLPVDAVRRHLDVLVSLGLIKAISQRAGGGGSVGLAFGNAYRLPRTNKAGMANSLEPDLVKSTERERLMRIGKKTLRNRDASELARALIDEQELTNTGGGDE
jgi:DNA-binding transcriptional ArsR family regulator